MSASLLAALPLAAQEEPAAAGAGARLAGRVITHTGKVVPDAVVRLVGLRRSVAVDDEGRFEVAGLTAGSYLLEAESPLFGKTIARVELAAGESTEVDLVIDLGVHAEEIVVTASPDLRSQLELATPTNVLAGEDLRLRLQTTLGETLAGEPGISSTYFGPGASRPVIRGLEGDRVRMLQGGLGAGDVSSTSPDHAVSVDPLSADRIEVLRGPATLLYGSSAVGGVVNVLDGRIPDSRSAVPLTGTVDVRAGTAADDRHASVSLDGGSERWAWHVDALRRDAGDVEIPGAAAIGGDDEEGDFGTLANSDLDSASGSVGFSLFFGDAGFFGLSLAGFDSEYGIPGAGHAHEGEEAEEEEEEEGEEEESIRIDLEQRRLDLRGELTRPFAAFRGLKVRVGVTDYEHAELEGAERAVGTRFFNDAVEGRVELIQKERSRPSGAVLTGSLGLQASTSDLEALGEEAFIPPVETTNLALFAFQELARGEWALQAGARFEREEVSARLSPDAFAGTIDGERSFDGLSASLGAVWTPAEEWSLALSVARSVKMPNGQELYSNGAHFATRAFEIGDPGLGEESSVGVDLALRKKTGHFTGELTLFANRFDDFIFQAFAGEEREGLPVVRFRQADAEFFGAEVTARIGLLERGPHHVDLQLSGDLVRGELRGREAETAGNLPRIPPLRYGAGVHYDGGRLHGRIEVKRVEDQDRLAVNETPTDGYTLLGASFGYRFFVGEQIVDLLLRGTNLTDETARSHTSFLKDRVPLPGRDVGLAVRWTF